MRESLQLSKAMVREGDKPMKLELGDSYGNHCNWILHHLCNPDAWLRVELKTGIAIMVRWRQILFGFVVVEVGLIWEFLFVLSSSVMVVENEGKYALDWHLLARVLLKCCCGV